MNIIGPCKVFRTGDKILTPNGLLTIHYLFDLNGKKFFDLPFRLISHVQGKSKNGILTVYPYQITLLGE